MIFMINYNTCLNIQIAKAFKAVDGYYSTQLNFEFDPDIDKIRNLYQKCSIFLYNHTHFKADNLRLKPLFMHRYYS